MNLTSKEYYDSNNPKVGDVVYPGFTPVKAGRIVAVGPMTFYGPDSRHPGKEKGIAFSEMTVRQPNGKEFKAPAINLRCFRTLVEDHERKAEKHRVTLESIIAEIPKPATTTTKDAQK
jgi:hypothetical protein